MSCFCIGCDLVYLSSTWQQRAGSAAQQAGSPAWLVLRRLVAVLDAGVHLHALQTLGQLRII
jgi:hypothetical protein